MDSALNPLPMGAYLPLQRAFGHDVPVVAGRMQVPGQQAHAKILTTEFTDARDEIAMDITSAYDAPELQNLVWTFVFDRRSRSLSVSDDFEFSRPAAFAVALTTRADWKQLAPDQIELSTGGERVIAKIHAPGAVEVAGETIAEDCTPFTRLGIKLKDPLFKLVDAQRNLRSTRWMNHIGYTREQTVPPQPLGTTEAEVAAIQEKINTLRRTGKKDPL